MKSNTIKTLFWCLFITLIKIFPDPNLKLDINKYIFPVVLIITLCLVHFIPKKTISISIGIIATGAMAFYSITYFVYALPIVLLYASHTCAVSQYETFKQKEKFFPFSTVFSFVSLLSLILQILYCQEAKTHTENTDSLGDLAYEIFYIALLVVLFIICVTDKSTYKRKISRKVTINFIFCYLFVLRKYESE